jgi:hypothetical protein
MGFTKLDERILQSSIMAESPIVFKVWITLLAACESNGIAYVSPIYLASICHLRLSQVQAALERLQSPDSNSRSTHEDGRRIRRIDGGFEIINYLQYREAALRDAEAERKRLYRQKNKECPDSVRFCPDSSASASVSVNIKGDSKGENTPSRKIKYVIDESGRPGWNGITPERLELWQRAYPAVDIEQELARAAAWLNENPTRRPRSNYGRFLTCWLSRSQDRGGTRKRPEYRASTVGRHTAQDKPPEYWAEVRRLSALGITGDEISSMMEDWEKKRGAT